MNEENEQLEGYLHAQIPISSAMGVRVIEATPHRVRLGAPLAPNINHRSTIFGGSAAAIAILAGWALLHVRLRDTPGDARVVIQKSSIDYRHPIDDGFEAVAREPESEAWERFERTLARRGRARLDIEIELLLHGRCVGSCSSTYVGIAAEVGGGVPASA